LKTRTPFILILSLFSATNLVDAVSGQNPPPHPELPKFEPNRIPMPDLPKQKETPFWIRSLPYLIVPIVLAIFSALVAVLRWIFRKNIGAGRAPPNLLEQERIDGP